MKKGKKSVIILLITIVVLLLISLFVGNKDSKSNELSNDATVILNNAQTESSNVKDSEKKEFQEITVADYLNYYEGEEKTLILLARPTCHYCQIAEPILHKIAYDYDLDIKYLNTDEFSEEDSINLVQSNDYFNNGYGTPVLLLVSNGEIIDMVDGLTDTAHYVKFFKDNKFIK